jgi:hypothetical protein
MFVIPTFLARASMVMESDTRWRDQGFHPNELLFQHPFNIIDEACIRESLPIVTRYPSIVSALVAEIQTAIQAQISDAPERFVCSEDQITKAGGVGSSGEMR